MKIITSISSIVVVLLITLGCGLTSAPVPTKAVPSPLPATNTSEPAAIPAAAATEAPTDVPIDLNAPYDENASAQNDIVKAFAQAEKDGKLVLLDFGANWCPDCLVLSTLFEDSAVKPFLEENYHVVRIDIGFGDKNLDIAQQYENPIAKGIPAVVVLAPNGEIIATTKDGSLANARTATAQDILTYLQAWRALKP